MACRDSCGPCSRLAAPLQHVGWGIGYWGVEREREDAEQREKDGEQTIYERFRDTALEFLGLQKKENLNDFSLHQLQFR